MTLIHSFLHSSVSGVKDFKYFCVVSLVSSWIFMVFRHVCTIAKSDN